MKLTNLKECCQFPKLMVLDFVPPNSALLKAECVEVSHEAPGLIHISAYVDKVAPQSSSLLLLVQAIIILR